MNRVQGASRGYMEQVANQDLGWVIAGLLLLVAFFLGGYLWQKQSRKRKSLGLDDVNETPGGSDAGGTRIERRH
ncbi:MAG: hypothetical protein HQL50_11975 [Magnetococcales bacterium]|nr:hypothetical protein [Magnetococcales bacterium]